MSTILPAIFQRFCILLLLTSWTTPAWSSQPIHVYYRPARKNLADAMMDADSKLHKGDFEGARRTTDAMIKMDPTFYVAYFIRAEALMEQHKYQEALRDCNTALQMDHTFGEAALLRAKINYHLGHYAESLKELDHVTSIPLRSDAVARAYSERAWFRLNCPDRSFHDAHQAVKDATMACRLMMWRDEDMLDTLATAYAETGDFDSAVRYEKEALGVKGVKSDDAKRLQKHLDAFERHKTG